MREDNGKVKKFRDYFPPGYEYEDERNSACILLGIGAALSLQYFRSLYGAVSKLYEYADGRRVLRENVVADSFKTLVTGHWGLYIPLVLFVAAMAVYHYFYYRRQTRSIYLMRRLPQRGVLLKSCIQGPLLELGISAALLAVWYLIYYGIYLLVIPAECLPH